MKPKKKLIRTVSLRFFQDDANGEWGTAHKETYEANGGNGFNAFWDGRGLFHDVFEHAHELTDKHFFGQSAMNIGGEIVAMGSLWYYYHACGMSRRLDNPFFNYQTIAPDDNVLRSTLDMMSESISEGYSNFGDTLESSLPRQAECEDSTIEWLAEEHFNRVQAITPGRLDADHGNPGQTYKDSVTLEKLQNLYRYGYKIAKKLAPSGLYRNGDEMTEFVTFWNEFCKKNKAETLATLYRSLVFKIYRDTEGILSWVAEFVPVYGVPSDEVPPVKIRSDANSFYVPVLADY